MGGSIDTPRPAEVSGYFQPGDAEYDALAFFSGKTLR